MSVRIVRALVAASPLLLAPSAASAQSRDAALVPGVQLSDVDTAAAWGGTWDRPDGCQSALQPTELTRRVVDLDARMPPNTPSSFIVQSELLAREVDIQLRTLLGGSESVVPDADSSIKWSAVPAELIVTARPDGRMTWRQFAAFGDSSATRLLASALDSARRRGAALLIWPEGYAADSIDFRLSLLPSGFLLARSDSSYKRRMSFGAFAVLMPKFVPALPVKGGGDIVYPHNNEFRHVTGQVITQFVVDTTGRAVMSTFRDVWPADKPRLDGSLGRYYEDFVSAIRNYAAKAKFIPARIGSCTVREWIQLPVKFQGPHYEGAYSR